MSLYDKLSIIFIGFGSFVGMKYGLYLLWASN